MAATAKALQQHHLRILRLWPRDALRSLSVHDAMRRRLASRFPPSSSQSSPSPSQSQSQSQSEATANNEADLTQLNALYSLLENRYARQYPVSATMLHPPSNPAYYDSLAAEMEAAPRRSWLARKWMRLSRVVRFS